MTADPGSPPSAPPEGPPRYARDVMSRIVDAAEPDTDLYTVARMMAELAVSAVPVVDSTDAMRPLGIITERDIVVRVIAKNQTPDELRAGDVMTPAVITVRTDTPLDECMRRMAEHNSQRALVVDEQNRLVGIIAQADIERALLQDPRPTSPTPER
jgi:CBS domain-containing protein